MKKLYSFTCTALLFSGCQFFFFNNNFHLISILGEKVKNASAGRHEQRWGKKTRVTIPGGYHLKKARLQTFNTTSLLLKLYARNFAQGEAVYLEIIPNDIKYLSKNSTTKCFFQGKQIAMSRKIWGYRGLFGIHPAMKPGQKIIKIISNKKTFKFRLTIHRTRFPVFKRSMDLGRYSNKKYLQNKPKIIAEIQRNKKKKRKAFSFFTSDKFSNKLSHPRDIHRITSPFYAKRITKKYILRKGRKYYKKPRVSRHRGVDLKGNWGSKIFSIADGRVVIAEKMYYEGNFILIDHGKGIFSGYMHQSKILVKEGADITAGQLIGQVGSSGMVTGPHLHLILYIRGITLNGLSLLSLPIRN